MNRDDWVVLLVVVVLAVAGIVVLGYVLLSPDCGLCDEAGYSVSNAPGR
jgi:hypothetical protein